MKGHSGAVDPLRNLEEKEGDIDWEIQSLKKNAALLSENMDEIFSKEKDNCQDLLDENKQKLQEIFLTIIRFSSIESAESFLKSLIESKTNNLTKEYINQIYCSAMKNFLEFAPVLSRYIQPNSMIKIKIRYYNQTGKDMTLTDICQSDMEYGKKRMALASVLFSSLKKENTEDEKIDKEIIDEEIKNLPRSSSGKRKAAILLGIISSEIKYKVSSASNEYGIPRLHDEDYTTFMRNLYGWGKELAEAVKEFSLQECFEDSGYFLAIAPESENKKILTHVYIGLEKWQHGIIPVTDTWKYIEDTLEKICALDMRIKNRKTMTEFYSLAAELVWLIGNTTPFRRGSGSVAELFLVAVHLYHGIQTPVLKTEFPQLDVLDISFPLSDYRQLFPFFFEPNTLPECIRKFEIEEKMSSLSRKEQLKKMYEQIPHHTLENPRTIGELISLAEENATLAAQYFESNKQYFMKSEPVYFVEDNHSTSYEKMRIFLNLLSPEDRISYCNRHADRYSVSNWFVIIHVLSSNNQRCPLKFVWKIMDVALSQGEYLDDERKIEKWHSILAILMLSDDDQLEFVRQLAYKLQSKTGNLHFNQNIYNLCQKVLPENIKILFIEHVAEKLKSDQTITPGDLLWMLRALPAEARRLFGEKYMYVYAFKDPEGVDTHYWYVKEIFRTLEVPPEDAFSFVQKHADIIFSNNSPGSVIHELPSKDQLPCALFCMDKIYKMQKEDAILEILKEEDRPEFIKRFQIYKKAAEEKNDPQNRWGSGHGGP